MVPTTDTFPLGAAVRLADLDVDPYPILAELRAREPVSWVPETRMWFVTRRDDTVAVLRDAARFTTDAERSTIRDMFGAHMMTTDGETALRYKRSCLHAFRADTLAAETAPWVAAQLEALLGPWDGGRPLELMGEVATPLAVGTALHVLGLPVDLGRRIGGWYDDFAAALANFTGDPAVRARGKQAAAAFRAVVAPRLATARPSDRGLLAALATRDQDRLDDDEIVANALIILFGGIETTASMIGNTVWSALATDRWGWLAEEPARRPGLMEEALRWEPAVQSITRHAAEDVELRGVRIPAGSVVQCMIGGANRDPEAFALPNRFDPERTNASDHLSFGTGRHLCLGVHLARIEIRAVLDALAARAPSLHFSGPPPPLRGYEFRRPGRLEIMA